MLKLLGYFPKENAFANKIQHRKVDLVRTVLFLFPTALSALVAKTVHSVFKTTLSTKLQINARKIKAQVPQQLLS